MQWLYLARLKRGLGPAFGAQFGVINFHIFLQLISKAMAGKEKKEAKMKIQKFEYLENEKSFLDEIKNIFNSF